MGVFFTRDTHDGALKDRMQAAIAPHIEAALRQQPPDEMEVNRRRDDLATAAAMAASGAATGTAKPNWIGFVIGLPLFAILIAVAVFLDWKNVVDDPTAYSDMANMVLGVLLGFIGGEATGNASSR